MESAQIFTKQARGRECDAYSALKNIAVEYNGRFKILELPVPIEIDQTSNTIKLRKYAGRTYNIVWGESYGGDLMGLELSKETALVIKDLSRIPVERIENDSILNKIERLKFNFEEWLKTFNEQFTIFTTQNLLSSDKIEKAQSIFREGYVSTYIFNNGDFYPRNFIRSGNKIILVDWQTWDESYRANLLDYYENVFAFCYIHMWGNSEWTLNYLREMRKRFQLQKRSLQKALLIKSFDQAFFWRNTPQLFGPQLLLFKNCLDDEYMDYLFEYSKPAFWYFGNR